jgi:hypothetical protein
MRLMDAAVEARSGSVPDGLWLPGPVAEGSGLTVIVSGEIFHSCGKLAWAAARAE